MSLTRKLIPPVENYGKWRSQKPENSVQEFWI